VLLFLLRRIVLGVLVVLATAVFAYGGIRLLRPELYPGEAWLSGTLRDLERALLHLDFGEACMYTGCPSLHDLWVRGITADLWLLGGGLALGIALGVTAGRWCAAHPRSRAARGVEAVAMVFYCAPAYFVAYGLLLLFEPTFGFFPVPILFAPHAYAEPFSDVGDFVQAMTVPWLVVAAPVAAACLRITVGLTREAEDEEYLRTALAKGLSHRAAIGRHAAPAAYASVASWVGSAVPFVVLNVVIVEFVFSVPGFFRHTWRAFGKAPGFPPGIDYPTLQAVGLWAAVFIVVVGLLADLALAAIDPRIRAAGRVG
jgi:peptide/nickel transport system permease protein